MSTSLYGRQEQHTFQYHVIAEPPVTKHEGDHFLPTSVIITWEHGDDESAPDPWYLIAEVFGPRVKADGSPGLRGSSCKFYGDSNGLNQYGPDHKLADWNPPTWLNELVEETRIGLILARR